MFVRKKDLTTRKLEMFIRKKDLMTMLSVNHEDMDELISSDGFPKPIYVLEKYRKLTDMEMYHVKDINNWLLSKMQTVPADAINEVMNMSIETLCLSTRARYALINSGLATIGEITKKTEDEVREVRNCGNVTIKEIKEKLLSIGISFRKLI